MVQTPHLPRSDPQSGYTLQESILEIGDVTRVCLKLEPQPNGQNRVWYRIEFTYRNFYHAVVGHGWELEVRPQFVEAVARTLFAKLVAAPLVEGVTFVP